MRRQRVARNFDVQGPSVYSRVRRSGPLVGIGVAAVSIQIRTSLTSRLALILDTFDPDFAVQQDVEVS